MNVGVCISITCADHRKSGLLPNMKVRKQDLFRKWQIRIAMQNAKERSALVELSAAINAMVGIIESCKAKLAHVPAKVARGDLKLQACVAKMIDDALIDLSVTRVEEQRGADIESPFWKSWSG